MDRAGQGTIMARQGSLRERPLGATAWLGRSGYPRIRSETGGSLDIATGAAEAGFNPVDLLYASLSACMAMSARIAARRLGVMGEIEAISVHVTGTKVMEGEGDRVAAFSVELCLQGRIDATAANRVLHMAEAICTISNTLKQQATVEARLVPAVEPS